MSTNARPQFAAAHRCTRSSCPAANSCANASAQIAVRRLDHVGALAVVVQRPAAVLPDEVRDRRRSAEQRIEPIGRNVDPSAVQRDDDRVQRTGETEESGTCLIAVRAGRCQVCRRSIQEEPFRCPPSPLTRRAASSPTSRCRSTAARTARSGDYDMSWLVPHAMSDEARDHMTGMIDTATTALLGRKNFDGFGGFWPGVADMAEADPRDRAFSRWLNETKKVVFSSASGPTDWANTRFVDERPAAAVERLRAQPGGDILVLASGTVIRSLLADDHVDRLSITLCPEISGGGDRLFEDGLPATPGR